MALVALRGRVPRFFSNSLRNVRGFWTPLFRADHTSEERVAEGGPGGTLDRDHARVKGTRERSPGLCLKRRRMPRRTLERYERSSKPWRMHAHHESRGSVHLVKLVMTAVAVYALPHFNHTRAVISHVALDDKATSPQQSKGTTGSGDDADSGGNASQLSTKRRNWWGSK